MSVAVLTRLLKQAYWVGPDDRDRGRESPAEARHNEQRRRETDRMTPVRMRTNAAQAEERRARARATGRRLATEDAQRTRRIRETPRGINREGASPGGRVWVRGYYRTVQGRRVWVAGHWEQRLQGRRGAPRE